MPCQSSMPVIHASHPCQSSMPVLTPPHTKLYQQNHTKPYHISSLYLQLIITAISIHNATAVLPLLEDRDCKPFSACSIYRYKAKHLNMQLYLKSRTKMIKQKILWKRICGETYL